MKVSFFEKAINGVSYAFNLLSSAALAGMMLLTCADVFMRYLFSRPIIGTYDLVSLMGAVLVAFAMPYTMLKKGHVSVELLIQSLSGGKQLIVETFTHLLGISLFGVLIWQAILLSRDMKAAGEVTPTLFLPFYPILYCMAVCFFALCLAILVNLLRIWTKRAK
ncbi:MAG: TRAP transporter small permease [Deltaproteobacteria bacterium]|nr:TRAP transporter small permease [Deltaproteobacteria bacterium]MCF8120144.1 TRAP transporter small permease [Deltaproteobacteria bacterium]